VKSLFDFIGRTEATRGGLGAGAGQRKAQAPWSAPRVDGAGQYSKLNPYSLSKISKTPLQETFLYFIICVIANTVISQRIRIAEGYMEVAPGFYPCKKPEQ
jgi:hypothetical protein